MRHSYDQSEYTRPGEEFSLPPEQSATLSGGRRLTDRFGVQKRNLAEPNETERQAAEVLAEEGPVGKKMDFIVQEINREVNTTGSKANDIEITSRVLSMKNLVEEIREQIQNLV